MINSIWPRPTERSLGQGQGQGQGLGSQGQGLEPQGQGQGLTSLHIHLVAFQQHSYTLWLFVSIKMLQCTQKTIKILHLLYVKPVVRRSFSRFLLLEFPRISDRAKASSILNSGAGRDARWNISLWNISKFRGNFEIFQDPFFEIFHEIFNFHYKVT